MSGGVDSSVVAYLLTKEGYEVLGATMSLLENDKKTQESIEDAKEVCKILNIPHYVFHLEKEFHDIVIKDFMKNYQEGLTPNPCITCNKHFKFGLFFKKAQSELGIDLMATGHYATIENQMLKRSINNKKDQSYFLYGIKKEMLPHIIFPLSKYKNKDQIRETAKKANLKVNSKKDSQEICFIPNDDYKAYLQANIEGIKKEGNIRHINGEILGTHQGIYSYTIGQRKGLGISYKEPLYVISIDKKKNEIIVGPEKMLYKTELIAVNINLLVKEISTKTPLFAKVRSRGSLEKVTIEWLEENKMKVNFLRPQRAITLGQSVVLYDQDSNCLGGGIIQEIK